MINETIIEILKSYPTDGTFKYDWPKDSTPFAGVTRDIIYKGEIIAAARENKTTYCCGITFEVWFRSCMKLGVDLGTIENLKNIYRDWYIVTPNKRAGQQDALVPRRLGKRINLNDAQPGDFIQIWRSNGSGHSVIYLAHDQNGIRYWSTQKSTNGIGERYEKFSGIRPLTEIYITRAIIN